MTLNHWVVGSIPTRCIINFSAAYLREIARSPDAGRHHRKQPKIAALRQYKEEILEAHRSGISIHRIAQIFRERNVDISTQHLMRAIRLFIAEGEGGVSKASAAQGTGTIEKTQKAPVTYQVPEPPSALVREEEFAKQLRLARYLAALSVPLVRTLEPALKARTPKQGRSIRKAPTKGKVEPARRKAGEAELAKERWRVGQAVQRPPSSGPRRSEKQRSGPSR